MTRRRAEITAGSVALLCFCFGLYAAHMKPARDSQDGYRLTATFTTVEGLPTDSEVRLSGVVVGAVEAQTLDDNLRPVLTLRLDESVALPVDSSASIQTEGLFGTKYVSIEVGGSQDIIPPGGDIAYTESSLVVTRLLSNIIAQGESARQEQKEELTRLRAELKAATASKVREADTGQYGGGR